MSPLERVHAAMDRLAEVSRKDLRLVSRRAYFDQRGAARDLQQPANGVRADIRNEHQVCGSYVAQIDGYQPLLSASATSPDAAIEELAAKVEAAAGSVGRMMGGQW